jgi:hypothetical protein
VGFDVTDQLVNRFLHSSDTGEKMAYNERVHQLFTEFKKAYDSIKREEFYNNLIKVGVPMKKDRLIKMCFKETYSLACIGKHISDMFSTENGLKQGDCFSTLL